MLALCLSSSSHKLNDRDGKWKEKKKERQRSRKGREGKKWCQDVVRLRLQDCAWREKRSMCTCVGGLLTCLDAYLIDPILFATLNASALVCVPRFFQSSLHFLVASRDRKLTRQISPRSICVDISFRPLRSPFTFGRDKKDYVTCLVLERGGETRNEPSRGSRSFCTLVVRFPRFQVSPGLSWGLILLP